MVKMNVILMRMVRVMRRFGRRRHCLSVPILLFGILGCADNVKLPSSEQLHAFLKAVPPGPAIDTSKIEEARIPTGPYRVMPDDVIEFTIPAILKVVTADSIERPLNAMEPYLCRVSKQGTITLPVIGEMIVAGLSLAEIEKAVIDAYHPRYTKVRPSVFARIQEFKTYKVTVSGAVRASGVYELHWDQMTLINLLMAAGGIADQGQYRGAALIRIRRNPSGGPIEAPRFEEFARDRVPSDRPISLASVAQWPHDRERHDQMRLAFRRQGNGSRGRLHIQRKGRILVNRTIDLTDSADRHAMLRQVLQRDPEVSIDELNQRLVELAHILQRGAPSDSSVRLASLEGFGDVPEGVSPAVVSANDIGSGNTPRKIPSDSFDETIVLPVKGLNIPFADVALHEGDSVIVERLVMPVFTVLGLVNRPGNYEYPPDVNYNLVQALGFAGGLNLSLDPRYVTIYRLKQDGSIARAPFRLKKDSRLTQDLAVPILPGDVIAVEHTLRTRTTQFLNNVFRISIGTYIRTDDLFD